MVTKKRKSLKTKRKQRGGAGLKVLNLPQPPKNFDNTLRRPSSGDYPLKSGNTLRRSSSEYEKFHLNNSKYVKPISLGSLGSLGRRNSGISVNSGSSISSDSSGSSVDKLKELYGHQPTVPPRNLAYDTGTSNTNNNSGPLKISGKSFKNFNNNRERINNLSNRTKTLRRTRSNLRTTYRQPIYSNSYDGKLLVNIVLKSGKKVNLEKLINLNKKSLSGLTENDYFNRLQELIKKDKNFINSVRKLDNQREKEALARSIQNKQDLQSDLEKQLKIYLRKQKNNKVVPATSLPKSQVEPNEYVSLLSAKEIEKRSSGNSGTNISNGYISFGEDDV